MTQITTREIGMVQRMASSLTATRGPGALREDLVGSGLLGLAEAAGRFDPKHGAPFIAMASITAKGRMLDMLRRERRGGTTIGQRTRPEIPGGEQVLVARDPACAPPPARKSSLESTLTKRELVRALRVAINDLPARERIALKGCFLEGRRSEDLARELGVSRRAVNLMCKRARRRLKSDLAHLGDLAVELLG